MSRIRLKKVDQISRKTVSDARDGFLRHCQLKNLAPHTYTYYKENLQFFFDSAPQVKFVAIHRKGMRSGLFVFWQTNALSSIMRNHYPT